jgi:hypothetical protein
VLVEEGCAGSVLGMFVDVVFGARVAAGVVAGCVAWLGSGW